MPILAMRPAIACYQHLGTNPPRRRGHESPRPMKRATRRRIRESGMNVSVENSIIVRANTTSTNSRKTTIAAYASQVPQVGPFSIVRSR